MRRPCTREGRRRRHGWGAGRRGAATDHIMPASSPHAHAVASPSLQLPRHSAARTPCLLVEDCDDGPLLRHLHHPDVVHGGLAVRQGVGGAHLAVEEAGAGQHVLQQGGGGGVIGGGGGERGAACACMQQVLGSSEPPRCACQIPVVVVFMHGPPAAGAPETRSNPEPERGPCWLNTHSLPRAAAQRCGLLPEVPSQQPCWRALLACLLPPPRTVMLRPSYWLRPTNCSTDGLAPTLVTL